MLNDSIAAIILKNPRLRQLLWHGRFGMEVERLRVDAAGKLALTPHPEALGNKGEHPYITTDFSESQLELITPPMDSIEAAYGFLKTTVNVVQDALPAGELLWPQSMPPILPEEADIPLARFDGDTRGRTEYREHLSKVYGRARQTISGAHFNFSFVPEFFELLAADLGETAEAVKERVYLKVVRNLMRDRWLLVGLLGRSPIAHETLRLKALDADNMASICCDYGVSIRCSRIGYRNRDPLVTDYCCAEGYLSDLETHIRNGKLLNPNELYLPIRLKVAPTDRSISHIELRAMDLDPADPVGVDPASAHLSHLFILYALLKSEGGAFNESQQREAEALQNQVACWGFEGEGTCPELGTTSVALQPKALALMNDLEACLHSYAPDGWSERDQLIGRFRGHIAEPGSHPASQLRSEIRAAGFIDYHLKLAQTQEALLSRDAFKLHAFPDLELSTQLLLKACIRRGIGFELLDRKQNFVRLSKGSKVEYVVQATKTSLDRYSHILAMENKKVTKQLLRERGVATPGGSDYDTLEAAKQAWAVYQGQPVAIKPMSTNFGLGISIIKDNQDRVRFERAVEVAFQEDRQILIEPFIPGKEYRFFLIGEQVVAILHRVPANVVGDGRRTIRELVALKNEDPLRGKGYVTPLERIELGEPESFFLSGQGLDFESVPADGETVYLREISNISTGGDSIDFTDRMHPSYSAVASAAAHALGVSITGLDMMIQDYEAPAQPDNHAVIELNFNPAIHIHCYPYQGQNRKLDERILSALGFV